VGIETIGEAWNFGWHLHMRCLDDGKEGLKHRKRCAYRTALDLQTLVSTRGRDFPLARISERLRCPRCGCRRVAVMFGPPTSYGVNTATAAVAKSYLWRAIDEE
jgi:hypothetical protein